MANGPHFFVLRFFCCDINVPWICLKWWKRKRFIIQFSTVKIWFIQLIANHLKFEFVDVYGLQAWIWAPGEPKRVAKDHNLIVVPITWLLPFLCRRKVFLVVGSFLFVVGMFSMSWEEHPLLMYGCVWKKTMMSSPGPGGKFNGDESHGT